VHCEPIVGYMHRGAEKLFEVRDYRQIIVLANRHDWLSAFSNELGVVLAVERMMGMEVPVRAVWLRTLLAELNRVLNHLMFLGSYPLEVGAITPIFYAFRERETIQQVMEELSGGRMHYMFNRVGGLKEDMPAGWLGSYVRGGSGRALTAAADRGPGARQRDLPGPHRGGGRAVPGAGARVRRLRPDRTRIGVDFDLRRDDPYLAYEELLADGTMRVLTRSTGDCYARFELLMAQAKVSLDIADACIERLRALPPGPINVRLPKILKAPEGSTYAWTENPLGVNGYYLVSRGEKTPWRMKMRTASFNNISVLPQLLDGCVVADMVAILGSMFFVVGDVDK
jgi:NADH-quinone oxidoreductase subunit D